MTAGPLSVIVPAYNEACRIGSTLEHLARYLSTLQISWEVRVVDDGSTDDTTAIVEAAAHRDARIVLQQEPHRGKGGAVRAGMLAARSDLRFLCDADLSMPVHELSRFLALVPDRCEIAIGSREGAGARRVGEPTYRHWMGRLFNSLVRLGTLSDIRDTQCGFKMFTGPAADLVFPRALIDGWAFDVEILTIARRKGLRIVEVPIEWHYRELSRVSPRRDAFRMARDVLVVRARTLRGLYDNDQD